MPTNRLTRSFPYWVLVGGSVVAIAAGAYLLVSKLIVMEATLTDGTATGVEVYAGQTWAIFGAIVLGAGLVGLVFALALAAARSLVPAAEIAAAAPIVWEDEVVEIDTVAPLADEVAADAAETPRA